MGGIGSRDGTGVRGGSAAGKLTRELAALGYTGSVQIGLPVASSVETTIPLIGIFAG
jgi:hypothetical protein